MRIAQSNGVWHPGSAGGRRPGGARFARFPPLAEGLFGMSRPVGTVIERIVEVEKRAVGGENSCFKALGDPFEIAGRP